MMYYNSFHKTKGFSLVEIAIGLVIIGLVIGSFLAPISSLRNTAKAKEAQKALDEIHHALIGFAINNSGRLPCPATTSSNGKEVQSGSNCSQEHGFVPGVTLGLQGSHNPNNLLRDPWGNPYRYSFNASANYEICTQSGCPGTNTTLAANIAAIFFSTGKDGAISSSSPDQRENTDSDNQFVKRTHSEGTTTAFDDHLHWLSPNVLSLYLSR